MCGRCLHSAGTELLSVDTEQLQAGYAVLVSENFSPDEPESKQRQVGLCVQCSTCDRSNRSRFDFLHVSALRQRRDISQVSPIARSALLRV